MLLFSVSFQFVQMIPESSKSCAAMHARQGAGERKRERKREREREREKKNTATNRNPSPPTKKKKLRHDDHSA